MRKLFFLSRPNPCYQWGWRLADNCCVGLLEIFLDSETFKHKGLEISLNDVEYSKCNTCNVELTTPVQSRNIDYRLNDEYRKLKGLLTGKEIKRIRKKLDMKQIQLAKIVGGGINRNHRVRPEWHLLKPVIPAKAGIHRATTLEIIGFPPARE